MKRFFVSLLEYCSSILFVSLFWTCGTVIHNPGDKKEPPDTTQRDKTPVKTESPTQDDPNGTSSKNGAAIATSLFTKAPQILSAAGVVGAKMCGQVDFTDLGEKSPSTEPNANDLLQVALSLPAIEQKLLFAVYDKDNNKVADYPFVAQPETALKIVLFKGDELFCLQNILTKARLPGSVQRMWRVTVAITE